ncbi:hypothetical protein WJX72_002081 [[Myrmecia] bisecta]|uniref:Uncharacterized protein n=1 Tax=[Myrmecia] bisecta TaxID=41462 RepID=A0AAW1QED3_9CHLO
MSNASFQPAPSVLGGTVRTRSGKNDMHQGSTSSNLPSGAKEAADKYLSHDQGKRLDVAFDELEDNLNNDDGDVSDVDNAKKYDFNEMELEVFRYLVKVMRDFATGLLAVAGSIAFLAIVRSAEDNAHQIPGIVFGGIGLSSVAHIMDAVIMGLLVWMGAVSFKKVFKKTKSQLTYVFQGIMQLGVIFMQLSTVTLSFAIIQMLEAAVRWPRITVVVAGALLAVALVRTAAMSYVMAKYTPGSRRAVEVLRAIRQGESSITMVPRIDRAALFVVGGLMLPFSHPLEEHVLVPAIQQERQHKEFSVEETVDMPSEEELDARLHSQYEFSRSEGQILEVVMDGMRMGALALALQALSTIMLGIAKFHTEGIQSAYGLAFSLADQTIRSALLFASAGCFHQVVSTEGRDMTHLLEGLDKEQGLGLLFFRMQKLAWSLASARCIAVFMPYIKASWPAQKAWAIFASLVKTYIVPWLPTLFNLKGMVAGAL